MAIVFETAKVKIYDDFSIDDLNQLNSCLKKTEGTIEIDLEEADADDSKVVAGMTALLKRNLVLGLQITLVRPPQVIVHNLYRVDFYPHPLLTVIEMRQDEPYG
jgi:hypothetical protein